jgi:hypothetical protein
MAAYDNYPPGLVPIGGVIPWLKSLTVKTGAPALTLSPEFVECNGQTLHDPQSLWDGKVIPDLNGITGSFVKRFLRGSSTSGTTGGTEAHTHTIGQTTPAPCTCGGCCGSFDTAGTTGSAATLPSYYEVVWVMRIK